MLRSSVLVTVAVIVDFASTFECYTCHPRKGHDCVEQKNACPPGVSSCSVAVSEVNQRYE
ncbi:hypothetical protein KIN20_034676 [Parelaphostrongylus tenuis]|uniref:Uncharacterized protein n=1 Tax=Parelaphostrongylus tenuis TaxID=148309 RepID=A0AAD5RA34_PARTN|nr:hypothetical protein KIN20_034676 [Parelaphostrongylus tenuis]